jgi:putative phage-type endonuclease
MQLQQNTPEWLEFRKNYLGASDAPIIMGDSPWRTPFQLWKDKLGVGEPQSMSSAMQRGVDMEQAARDWFEDKTGIAIYPEVVLHPEIPYLMASIDGMSEDRKIIVEIKCPGKADHCVAKNGSPPAKYYSQLQHQIEVCKVEKTYYLSFDGKDGILLVVEKDEDYIKNLLTREAEFWDCVNEFRAPDLCDRDYIVRDDDIWLELAEEWNDLQEKLRCLQDREKELRSSFGVMADGRNCHGGGIKVTKVIRKGVIDYASIPGMNLIDVEKYRRKPTEFLKISNLPF